MTNIIIIFLFLFINLIQVSSQWLPDIKITNSSARSFTCFNNSKGSAASGNFVHIVWFDERISTNREVYYRRSTNYGTSFEPDVRLTDSTGASEDACVSAVGSTVHVLWKDQRNNNMEIYYKRSTDNGTTWGNDTRLTNNPSYSMNPSLSASENIIHAVWDDYRDNGNGAEIYYKRSTDNGATWSGDIRLTNNTSQSSFPSVSSQGQDVHIVWSDSRDTNYEIYYKHSTDGGATWGADTRITSSTSTSDDPCVNVSGSYVHVGWKDNRDGNVEAYYKHSTDNGATWGTDTRLSTTSGQTWYVSVASSGANVHIFFNDYTGNGHLYYSRSTNYGSSWSSSIFSTHTLGEFRPSVTVKDSSVHLVWTDTRDQGATHEEVYYKRNPTGLMAFTPLGGEVPVNFSLSQNFPNPFNPVTNIKIQVPNSGNVKLAVFDITGKEAAVLVNENLAPGVYNVDWNASEFPSGVYFYRIETESFSETKKMILVK